MKVSLQKNFFLLKQFFVKQYKIRTNMKYITDIVLLFCFLVAGVLCTQEYREKHALSPVWDASGLQRTLQRTEWTFPTPHGVIAICHEKYSDGNVKHSVNAPDRIEILRNQNQLYFDYVLKIFDVSDLLYFISFF
jgi:hypothetical protein